MGMPQSSWMSSFKKEVELLKYSNQRGIINIMIKIKKDWEFNVLGIYNFRQAGRFDSLFSFIKENHEKIDGDILEAGVFRGSSLLAIGMFLKELGSNKKVYGFDSFSGFPPVYHPKDDLFEFERMAQEGLIGNNHIIAVRNNLKWKTALSSGRLEKNISSSGSFSDTSLDLLNKKIEIVGLDNIVLVDGAFNETMQDDLGIDKLMAAVIDCDLYQSYLDTFKFVWPRLQKGGFIHLDEYFSLKFPGGRLATDEFFKDKKVDIKMSKQKRGDFERWYAVKS